MIWPLRAIDLVDRVGVARGHEEVPVRVHADRVQVDVVPVGAEAPVGVGDRDVVEAVPLEQHAPGRDVDLLEDRILDRAVLGAADGPQVVAGHEVGREQRGPAVGQQELMEIAAHSVAGVHVRQGRVRGVGDHVAPDAVPEHDLALPPRERGAAHVALHPEVGGDEARQRLLPHRVSAIGEDDRSGLRVGRRVVRREQEQPRRDDLPARGDRQRGDPQVRAGCGTPAPRERTPAPRTGGRSGQPGGPLRPRRRRAPRRRRSRSPGGATVAAGRRREALPNCSPLRSGLPSRSTKGFRASRRRDAATPASLSRVNRAERGKGGGGGRPATLTGVLRCVARRGGCATRCAALAGRSRTTA